MDALRHHCHAIRGCLGKPYLNPKAKTSVRCDLDGNCLNLLIDVRGSGYIKDILTHDLEINRFMTQEGACCAPEAAPHTFCEFTLTTTPTRFGSIIKPILYMWKLRLTKVK